MNFNEKAHLVKPTWPITMNRRLHNEGTQLLCEYGHSVTLEEDMGATMIIECATEAKPFEAYDEHFLVPTLEKGQPWC